ncbi:TonB-dependent receptor [Sphingomonas sp. HITSZ_GF]|uniref:TonB-dependent receptor n=1 Tax=Sphingomonas sp. HITSZ_GF TaxID=3037247 RepID=UPI00240E8A5E|nr:TonB-dependent receptor [Sphingomonas sp. HITSZ_GF]MDG2533022.1 TonB-dependent receptor [Sphingomonas sp. HITSZ_GF]
MRMRSRRQFYMLGFLASTALSMPMAYAQEAPQAPAEKPADAAQAVNGDEIIVTANKREERLQDVPVSISAISSDSMDKLAIQTPKDFGQIAPTLNFQAADEARLFNFSIRGIGTESFSVGVEPSVATIVDGVVYTRPGAVFDGLGDIERVEVLNGPQGTLQGKNASAGAVNIVTKRPNKQQFEGRIEGTLAENNEYGGTLMLTGPISPTLAFRAFGYYHHEDGVVINVATGDPVNNATSYGGKLKLEWEPAPGVNLLLAGDISQRDADCCGEPIRVAAASGNVTAAFTHTPVGPDNRYVNFDTVQEGYQKNRGASLEANFEIGTHTLTSITAYRQFRDFAIRDRDGTNAPFTGVTPQQLYNATVPGISAADATARLDALLLNPLSFACQRGVCGESNNLEMNNTFTQELRLTSPTGGVVDYIVGLYYYDAYTRRNLTIGGVRSNIAGNVSFPTPTTYTINRDTAYVLADMITQVKNTNKAVFGNLNVHPVKGLTLTGGFRYLRDELWWHHQRVTAPNGDHIGSVVNVNVAGQPAPGANTGTPQFDVIRDFADDELIGKLGIKYDFTPDVMVYASWAKGYKGQAVDADMYLTQAGYDASPVAPEKSRSWEIGLKSQWFDRALTVNVTAYDTKFTGYQTASTGTDGSGAPVLRSAGELFTKGVEGEVVLRPARNLRLSGNFLFSDNKFGDLFVTSTLNLKGGTPLNAPATKWGLAGSYDVDLGSDWGLNFTSNYNWTSKTLFTNLNDATNPNSVWLRPSFGVANATLTLTSPESRYKFSVYVKNLFNEHYVASLRRISGSVGGAGAVAQALPRDFDRYIGGTVSIGF